MKINITVNGKYHLELSDSDFMDIVSFLSNRPNDAAFYDVLSNHPASRVRAVVASKSFLPLSTYHKLADDPCLEVVQYLASNSAALRQFDTSTVRKLIDRDVSIAVEMAFTHINELQPSIRTSTKKYLKSHPDPAVRIALEQ